MLQGINNKEYCDYLKYYSEISNNISDINFFPEAANESEKG